MPLTCPDCARVLEPEAWRHRCATCKGTYVANADVIACVAEQVGEPFELPPLGEVGGRGCPECRRPMHRACVRGVEIDRCEAHGIWFDTAEITRIARASGGWSEEPTFWSQLFWSLFGRGVAGAPNVRGHLPPDDA